MSIDGCCNAGIAGKVACLIKCSLQLDFTLLIRHGLAGIPSFPISKVDEVGKAYFPIGNPPLTLSSGEK